MSKDHYHDYLRQVPIFANLDRGELDVVGRATTELPLPAGHVLLREGDLAHDMYVVLEGTLDVTRNGQHVAVIEAGGFAGEMALLTQCRRDATVTTRTAGRVLHIDGRSFTNVLRDAPHVAVNMLPIVAARVVANSTNHTD
jgi:CRP-like cAMP-binding protein